MRALAIALLLAGCSREPAWKLVTTHDADGWKLDVPAGYAPYLGNEAMVRKTSPDFVPVDVPDADTRFRSFFVMTSVGAKCGLTFTRITDEGLCDRHADERARSQRVKLRNGEWFQVTIGLADGGEVRSWKRCENDVEWMAMAVVLPDCMTEADAREPELVTAIGSAQLTRQ